MINALTLLHKAQQAIKAGHTDVWMAADWAGLEARATVYDRSARQTFASLFEIELARSESTNYHMLQTRHCDTLLSRFINL